MAGRPQESFRSGASGMTIDDERQSRASRNALHVQEGAVDGAINRGSDVQQRVSSRGSPGDDNTARRRALSPVSIRSPRSSSPHYTTTSRRRASPSPSRGGRDGRLSSTGRSFSPKTSQESKQLEIHIPPSPRPFDDREPYSSGYEEEHSESYHALGSSTPRRSKSPYYSSTPTGTAKYSSEAVRMNGETPLLSPHAFSPDLDKSFVRSALTPSPALRGAHTQDLRPFLIEKEGLESQIRKIQVEMSSLQSENKLIKEKFNQSQARVSDLESQVSAAQKENDKLVENYSNEVAALKRKSRTELESEKQELNRKISSLTRECEMLKAENSSFEKQLDTSKKSSAGKTKTDIDRIRTIETIKAELNAYKDQLKRMESMYEESEKQRQEEAERRKEAAQQIVRLTEMKNMLQQQLEAGGSGTVSEKQDQNFNAYAVKSLEKRLKVTEDRLQQERSDRAGKLSEVEEKLINENAKLQVNEKELKRKWERERNRIKNLEQRVRDLREENEAMSTALSNNVPTCYQALNEDGVIKKGNVPIKIPNYKKNSDEFKQLLRHIEKELGLRMGQEEEMIHSLWYKRDEAIKMLKEWELQLHLLKVDKTNISPNLRALVTEKSKYDQKLGKFEEELADEKKHNEEMECKLRNQIAHLIQEKHNALSKIRTLEDRSAGLLAENESLRMNLGFSTSAAGKATKKDPGVEAAQLEALTAERDGLAGQLQQQARGLQLLEGEVQTLKANLASKAQALEDAEKQVSRLSTQDIIDGPYANRQKNQIDKLNAEIKGLQAEVKHWQEKHSLSSLEKVQLEEQIDHLSKQIELNQSKLERLNKTTQSVEAQKLALETELSEKELQLIQVIAKFKESENDLQHTKQQLILEQETSSQLTNELESYQIQLDQKAGLINHLSGTEQDHKFALDSLQQNLDIAHADSTNKSIELHECKQELAQERTLTAQLKTEKLEVLQKLEATSEERDMYKREKDQLDYELKHRESEVRDLTRHVEEETRKVHNDKEEQCKNLMSVNKKVMLELEAAKRLNDAKERELNGQAEISNLQKDEIEAQKRKVLLLKEENSRCREDMQRMQEELTTRIKENSASVEVNQHLCNEKTALQMEKYQVEKDLDKEREILAIKKEEIAELTKKVEKLDDANRNAEKLLHAKENKLVALETELHHTNKSQNHLQNDHGQLQLQNNQLNEEVKNLTKLTASLEKQLETEKAMVRDEQKANYKLHNEVTSAQQQLHALQNDHDIALVSLDVERQSVDKLKDQCQILQSNLTSEEGRCQNVKTELDSVEAQLAITRETAEQHKEDKQKMYAELQDMCQKLEEKDVLVGHLQEKCHQTVESIQRDFEVEKTSIHKDKQSAEMQLLKAREQIDDLNEEVRQKEIQMIAHEKTLHDLEKEMKARQNLEIQLQQLSSELQDSKMLMGHTKTENVSQKETIKQLQDNIDKLKDHNASLRDKLHEQQDQLHGDVAELKQVYHDNSSKFEKEKNALKEKLSKTTANLKATEVSLSAANDAKDQLSDSNKTLEKTIEMLKTQLHEEITHRKLAEQKMDTIKLHLEDNKNKSDLFDNKVNMLRGQLGKTESELATACDKLKKVLEENHELEGTVFAHEARAQTLQEQVVALESENTNLHHQLEAKKIHMHGKNKRASSELKQQTENFEKERAKLVQQTQQLQGDLEKARNQIRAKNKETLRLNEELLGLEEKQRETSNHLKQLSEANQLEGDLQNKVNSRNQELESEVAALRATLGQLSSEEEFETRQGLNRLVQDLNKQLIEKIEAQKEAENVAMAKEEKFLADNKSKLHELESKLNTEKAMHQVTQDQLKAVEDDNQKLRDRLIQAKKNANAADRARHMTRMEEINELIARSQFRAQAMLASGYVDERAITPRGDLLFSMTPRSLRSPAPHTDTSDISPLGTMNGATTGLINMNANPAVFRPI